RRRGNGEDPVVRVGPAQVADDDDAVATVDGDAVDVVRVADVVGDDVGMRGGPELVDPDAGLNATPCRVPHDRVVVATVGEVDALHAGIHHGVSHDRVVMAVAAALREVPEEDAVVAHAVDDVPGDGAIRTSHQLDALFAAR